MCKRIFLLAGMLYSLSCHAQFSFPSAADGISFTSVDSASKVNMGFRIQSLASYSNNSSNTDAELNFLVRRMRLKFDGYVFSPKFGYKLELALSNRDMANGRDEMQVGNSPKLVLDAVFKYKMGSVHSIWFGQTKLPGNRERVISSQQLQFVDRSTLNSRFNIDRDFGIWFWQKYQVANIPYNLCFALSRGEGRNITISDQGGLCYTGRFEFYPFGRFQDQGDYTGGDISRESRPKLAVGLTWSHNDRTDRNRGQLGDFIADSLGRVYNSISTQFIDLMFKIQGLSIMAEYANRTLKHDHPEFEEGNAFVVQGGYLLENNLEFALRYTRVQLMAIQMAAQDYKEYTFCISHYILSHTLKWQCDFALIENFGDYRHRIRFQLEIGI